MSYKLGIIGTSYIAQSFCEAAKFEERIEIVTVYSRKKASGSTFCEQTGVPDYFTNFNNFLQSDIDIIYIASPNAKHYEQAKAAILAGKHVLLEKPLTSTVDQAEELYKLAKKNNVLLMEAFVFLKYNTYMAIKEMLEKIGRIVYANILLGKRSAKFDQLHEGINVFNYEMYGGAVYDLGPYVITPAIDLFGMPVGYTFAADRLENKVDLSTSLTFNYKTFVADLFISKQVNESRPSVIYGRKGKIEFDNINSCTKVVLYDEFDQVLETVEATYNHRMEMEIHHLCDLLDAGKITDDIYNQELSINSIKVFESVRI